MLTAHLKTDLKRVLHPLLSVELYCINHLTLSVCSIFIKCLHLFVLLCVLTLVVNLLDHLRADFECSVSFV